MVYGFRRNTYYIPQDECRSKLNTYIEIEKKTIYYLNNIFQLVYMVYIMYKLKVQVGKKNWINSNKFACYYSNFSLDCRNKNCKFISKTVYSIVLTKDVSNNRSYFKCTDPLYVYNFLLQPSISIVFRANWKILRNWYQVLGVCN